MIVESAKLVFFSPTGTTKEVVQAIARGFDASSSELLDITKPEARGKTLQVSEDDLLVVAVPVYMGRVPALVTEWLNTVQARNTPVVCVVVYGNREYDDALLELKSIVLERGCVPVACGAYIGEHSFSKEDTPVAQGRPDKDDLHHAEQFGKKVQEKLRALGLISEVADVAVPGAYPYARDSKLWDVDFIAVSDACTQCGVCAEVCPVNAIDAQDSSVIDVVKCITCCACIKSCPEQARSIKSSPVEDASQRLYNSCQEPKQPVLFL